VHGANRLASNSLLESVVFAWRVAALLNNGSTISQKMDCDDTGRPLSIEQLDGSVPVARRELQELMWNCAGIYRTEAGLRAGLAQLNEWCVPGESMEARETANMLLLARALLTAALERRESRGAHYREDFPAPSPALQHHLLLRSSQVRQSEAAA